MTILLQGFWKSFKSLLGIREPKKEVLKSPRSQEEPKEEAQVPKRQVEKDSAQIIRRKLEKVHLQVGLDFGTHSTKVVYSQIGKHLSRALNFKHNLPNYPNYCLPSVAAIDNHGKLALGIDAAKLLLDKEWDLGFQRFKVIVAGNHDKGFKDPISHENFYRYLKQHGYDETFTSERLTAIYLAYAMGKARELIERRAEYQDVELVIDFNICMPIDHIENNKVKLVFENIFRWGEAIDRAWHTTGRGFDPVRASYELENSFHNQDKRVFAVPESVAGMASYLVSLRKQEGLHAIIDLGAGTTDVSICNLWIPEDQLISYWYAGRNIPKGTINVERIVASHLKDAKNSFCTPGEICTFVENLGSHALYKKSSEGKNENLLHDILEEIESLRSSKEYYRTWGSAFRHLKKQSKWEKVEVFICGGGSNLPYVEKVFSVPWWNQIKAKYPVSRLPVPDDYDPGEVKAPFERMAVAYGLARPIPELDEYVLPGNAPDDTPPPLPRKDLPDRDDLYPK
jgi:hypothetical protein